MGRRRLEVALALAIALPLGFAAQLGAASAAAAAECSYYVSPSGSDSAAGTKAAPWKTLEKARDFIRAGNLNDNLTADRAVCLRGGRYTRTQTFSLTDADSGSNGHKAVYKAYPGERPIVDGGKAVTGWTQVSGQPYWEANVPVSSGYASYFRQLYVGGHRAQLAAGKGIRGAKFYDDPAIPNSPVNADRPTRAYDGIEFPTTSLKNYTNVSDIRLLHVAIGFKIDYFPAVAMTANGTNTRVRLQQPWFQNRLNRDSGASLNHDQTFYVQNAFEELDSPGEWYLNQATRKVYYYPRAGENVNTAGAYAPVVETLVDVRGASSARKANDIAFEGITFEHGNWRLPGTTYIGGAQAEALLAANRTDPNFDGYGGEVPGQIKLTQTNNVSFTGNTVRYSGNGGIQLLTGAQNTTVTGNVFHNLTAAGIIVGRWLDVHAASADRTKNAMISNNIVADTGDDYFPATGISLMNTYNVTVTHNVVHDTAFMGIHQRKANEKDISDGVDGVGKSTISYNETYNNTDKSSWGVSDSGAIYSFGAWPGTVVSHNHVHHVTSMVGTYSDNMSYQIRWDYNVVNGSKVHINSPLVYQPSSVYASHNYATQAGATTHFIFDDDGPPHIYPKGDWPSEGQTIVSEAGLEAAYVGLPAMVPTDNLASHSTLGANSGWSGNQLGLLWDGVRETGEAGGTANEAWAQFDLPGDYNNFTFTLQQDNAGTFLTTDWKVQRWSASQNAWIDIMPYQAINTANPVVYKPTPLLATTKLRLYVRNTKANGKTAVQEFTATGARKS
jgi:hypothetical protein